MQSSPLPLKRRHLLLAGLALAGARPAAAAQPMRVEWPRRKPIAPLRLLALDGSAWAPAAEAGHPLLLNFWASWCDSCREEMPALAALAERERARGLRVLAVNYRESRATVDRVLDGAAFALPVLLDADGSAARAFGVRMFPSTIAIGRDGRPRFVVVGECDWTEAPARRWLDELLAGDAHRGV